MNRLLVAAAAACLAQFALACTTERTEIYEPGAPAELTEGEEKIDIAQVSDDTPIAYPVPTDVAEPVDEQGAYALDEHRDWLTPGIKFSELGKPPVDLAVIHQLPNVDGVIIPTLDIDIADNVAVPSLGVTPLVVLDPPPSKTEAQATPGPF